MKRCVGIPGDRIKLQGGQIYINGKPLPRVGKQQKRYLALLKTPITEDFLEQNDLGDFNFPPNAKQIQDAAQKTGKYIIPYHLFTWPENFEKSKPPRGVEYILTRSTKDIRESCFLETFDLAVSC